MNQRILLTGGFVVLLAGMAIISLVASRPPAIDDSDPSDTRAVTLGRTVYQAHCASCHGANLEGAPGWREPRADGSMPAPPHDVTGHTWHHSDESLFTTVKYGSAATAPAGYKATMPGYANLLSDAEIHAVLAYIKSTWPAEIQQAQREGHS